MKFFCGVNGSMEALAGVALAARLAKPEDHIALYYSPPRIELPDHADRRDGLESRLRERLVRAVIDEARASLPQELQTQSETLIGGVRADAAMVEAAEQTRADVIVLGARGGGAIEGRSLGSTIQAVIRTSSLPVLVAPPSRNSVERLPLRVLLAIDETAASRQAAEFAGNLHFPAGSRGWAVSVVPRAGADVPKWAEAIGDSPEAAEIRAAFDREHAAEIQRRRDELSALSTECRPSIFTADGNLVREGDPAQEILRIIDEDAIDLAILGARRRSAWSRFFLGSVSDTVLTCAACSVLLVRERAAW